jgi:hypothetical protein
MTTKHRIYSTSVASAYPRYVAKAEKKKRTQAEVDEIICWLTGHSQKSLDDQLAKNANFENFLCASASDEPLPISYHRSGLRRARGRHPRTHHAGNPLPRQTDRRTRKGESDGENLAEIVGRVGAGALEALCTGLKHVITLVTSRDNVVPFARYAVEPTGSVQLGPKAASQLPAMTGLLHRSKLSGRAFPAVSFDVLACRVPF